MEKDWAKEHHRHDTMSIHIYICNLPNMPCSNAIFKVSSILIEMAFGWVIVSLMVTLHQAAIVVWMYLMWSTWQSWCNKKEGNVTIMSLCDTLFDFVMTKLLIWAHSFIVNNGDVTSPPFPEIPIMQLNFAMVLAVCCYHRHTFGNYMNKYYSIHTFIKHTTPVFKPFRELSTLYYAYKKATDIISQIEKCVLNRDPCQSSPYCV